MFPKDLARLCVFYTLSPLHAGSGQAVGAVDLPIQRERHTAWPHVQASGVKGAFRDWFYRYYEANGSNSNDKGARAKELTGRVFGNDETSGEAGGQAGAISVTDARLLAFPVRSNVAPFVWVTCPAVLTRLKRDLVLCPIGQEIHDVIPEDTNGCICIVGEIKEQAIVLEDLAVTCEPAAENVSALQAIFSVLAPQVTRLILVTDQNFSFLVETATEVQPQIKIDLDTGTAADGSLRYQELLPSDSVLYSLVFFAQERTSGDGLMAEVIRECVCGAIATHMQMGGDLTLGRGMMEVRWLPGDKGDPQ